ncbi:MAG: RHS repeat-associated core domain-containing protein, partial [Anaeromyxobacteraceae bacterium]
ETLLAYDYNGNTTRECRDHGDPTCQVDHDHLRELSWNEENRLTSVVEGGGRHVTSFLYNAAGQRVVKQGRGGDSITIGQFFNLKGRIAATKHVFVGETRLASKLLPPPGWDQGLVPVPTASPPASTSATTLPGCDPSGSSPNKCLPGAPPIAYGVDTTTVRPETYYYHADHLGSTSWVTDQNGKVHEHVEYYPYGEVWWEPKYDRNGAGVKGQQFLFTSKELDEETGLHYFGARYYDPKRARWESTDPLISLPIGNLDQNDGRVNASNNLAPLLTGPASLNRYEYGLDSPCRYTDPDGRCPMCIGAGVGAVVGGVGMGIASWKHGARGWDLAGDILFGIGAGGLAGATMGMGAEALGLVAAGGGAAVSELEAAAPEGEEALTTLYRGVMPAELQSIEETGEFINKGSAEGKYFSTTAEGVSSYAKQAVTAFKDPPYTMVTTQIQTSAITPSMQASVDGGIPAVVVPNALLPSLTPAVQSTMPIPGR